MGRQNTGKPHPRRYFWFRLKHEPQQAVFEHQLLFRARRPEDVFRTLTRTGTIIDSDLLGDSVLRRPVQC